MYTQCTVGKTASLKYAFPWTGKVSEDLLNAADTIEKVCPRTLHCTYCKYVRSVFEVEGAEMSSDGKRK